MTPAVIETKGLRVMLREARRTDQAYVTSTWAQNLCRARVACPGHRHACKESRALVDRVTDHVGTRIMIACDPVHTDDLMGWLAYATASSVRLLHFMYVRDRLRRKGVASALVRYTWPDHMMQAGLMPIVWTMPGPTGEDLERMHTGLGYPIIHQPIEKFLA